MADKLGLQVITPAGIVISEEVDEVVAPGELGEFGVLPGHVAFITLLMPGELRYRIDGSERKVIVWDGVAAVRDDRVTVLTDNVEDLADIDTEAARREVEAILEEIKNFSGNPKKLQQLNRTLRLAQVRAEAKE
ncbi:MAG: ATP synthase F1 subunit epsilon [Thermodesulfobacteriota bacterium]